MNIFEDMLNFIEYVHANATYHAYTRCLDTAHGVFICPESGAKIAIVVISNQFGRLEYRDVSIFFEGEYNPIIELKHAVERPKFSVGDSVYAPSERIQQGHNAKISAIRTSSNTGQVWVLVKFAIINPMAKWVKIEELKRG